MKRVSKVSTLRILFLAVAISALLTRGLPGMGCRKSRLIEEELPRKIPETEDRLQGKAGSPREPQSLLWPLLLGNGHPAVPDITRDTQRLSGPLVAGCLCWRIICLSGNKAACFLSNP